jgi:hypothetical protein
MISVKPNINKALRFIVPGSGVRFAGEELKRLLRPCVYVFVKNDLALYVGMSKNGLNRPFRVDHVKARRCAEECDELLVYYCHSLEAAEECETILIDLFQPKYNHRKKIAVRARTVQDNIGCSEGYARLYTKQLIEASALES